MHCTWSNKFCQGWKVSIHFPGDSDYASVHDCAANEVTAGCESGGTCKRHIQNAGHKLTE